MDFIKKLIVKAKARKRRTRLSVEESEILLECGSDELVRHYMKMQSFPEGAHLALLNRSDNLIACYTSSRSLSEEAERKLFAEKSKDLAKHYIHYNRLCLPVQRELLKAGNEELLEKFVSTYAFDEDDLELEFVKTASDNLVLTYVQKHELCDEAFKALIETRSSKLCKEYACEFYLGDDEEVLFLKKATDDEIWEYIDASEGLSPSGEMYLLKSGKVGLIKKYIQHWRLGGYSDCDENPQEMELLKLNNKDLLMDYVGWHEPCEDFVCELIKNGDADVALKLVSTQDLSLDAEELLFERGERFVECYFEHCSFGSKAEKKLVLTCPDGMIANYICQHGLGDEAQEDLIRKGDVEIIEFFIDLYNLCPNAQVLLVKTLNKDLIAYYDKKRDFDDKVWKVIAQTFFLNNL
ncbi:MAG: hypothetical protein J6T72_04610 [Alphaproteobacteria bacterium]|nr:hypothetical protein [Alphaproteobacteria bacterium]